MKFELVFLLTVMHVAVDSVMSDSALITVLRQEIDRYNHLLSTIETSLKELILAIKGEVIMSEPLEEAYNAILSQKVPQKWKVRMLYSVLQIYCNDTDRSGQIVQTQIRLLLEEQSDQGLHCLPFLLHCLDSLLYGRAT